MSLWTGGISGLILCGGMAVMAETSVVPDVVKPAVVDKQVLAAPDQVKLNGFLGTRIMANETGRLLTLDENLLLDPFRKRPGPQEWAGEHVGKWLHAATLAWANTGDAKLREKIDRVAAELIQTQLPDGYLGTYLPKDYWTSWDVWVHKYNIMGLLTYYRYTGNKAALEACQKMGDLLCATFGKDKRDIIKAGEHVGMAATSVLEPMVLLYRATGDQRYLDFCRYLLWAWDQPHGPKVLASLTEGKGVHQTANRKAYEMLSNLVGLCELYRTTGEKELLVPVTNAWKDIVAKRLYITGSTSQHEHFYDDYVLPNDVKAQPMENCVTVTWMQLNAQLLQLTGLPQYADQLECTAYNELLAAQHPTGAQWCYFTALEGVKPFKTEINCCASSGPRGVALLPMMAYGTNADGVVVNLLETGTASLVLADGTKVTLEQKTKFPVEGGVSFAVHVQKPASFSIMVRVPPACKFVSFSANRDRLSVTPGMLGKDVDGQSASEYCVVKAEWKDGDSFSIELKPLLRVIAGDHMNAGKVAAMYGPLVLAADEGANPDCKPIAGVSISSKLDVAASKLETAETPGGLFSVRVPAFAGAGGQTPIMLKMVPFAMVGNDNSAYEVWFAEAKASGGK